MAETEVESILREIRERVLSQQRPGQNVAGIAASRALMNGGNGAGEAAVGEAPETGALAAENLSLINSYLATTARAWDRLPPLLSNRSGGLARLELWLKRKLKSATRWFTWEQVNFNAAVHHALRDLLPVLSAYEQALRKLQARIDADREAKRVEVEKHQAEFAARDAELRSELRAELRAELARIHTEIESERSATEGRRTEMAAQLAALVSELRDRDEHMQDQQRVCFKQLSLETSEAAVLEDRARRRTEALLEELAQRMKELEKS
jgi:hypothetical protein